MTHATGACHVCIYNLPYTLHSATAWMPHTIVAIKIKQPRTTHNRAIQNSIGHVTALRQILKCSAVEIQRTELNVPTHSPTINHSLTDWCSRISLSSQPLTRRAMRWVRTTDTHHTAHDVTRQSQVEDMDMFSFTLTDAEIPKLTAL